jgi:hypothetical protein
VLAAASLFFPATRSIGTEIDCPYTPAMLRKVVYAGSQSASFSQASKDLAALAEAPVSRECVQRWTKRVGAQRVAEADGQAAAYQALSLPAQQKSPIAQVPQVVAVMMDGGRIQVRDRHEEKHDTKGYWKESLVGCCLKMTSQEHTADPCPTIPKTFIDPERINTLSREIKGFSGSREETEDTSPNPTDDREGRPETLVKSVVATRAGQEAFGQRLVAEAHARGFHAAPRKAFVADGAPSNWTVHRKYFSHYTSVLDFTHAVCYVYAAAMAGRSAKAGWSDYVPWAMWLWEGNVAKVIEHVQTRSEQLGPPPDGDESSPAAVVAKTLGYLKNQKSRMKYDQYRKLGLPITSSHIESTIKQTNRRMKGTEKFWHQGAEPILQLVADHLSETPRLDQFWRNRKNILAPMRSYQSAA